MLDLKNCPRDGRIQYRAYILSFSNIKIDNGIRQAIFLKRRNRVYGGTDLGSIEAIRQGIDPIPDIRVRDDIPWFHHL